MTAADLRAIAERQERGDLDLSTVDTEQAQDDRGALLALLRLTARMARSGPGIDRRGDMRIAGFGFVRPRYRSDDAFHDECIFCEADKGKGEACAPDCPAPVLEVLLPEHPPAPAAPPAPEAP